MSGLLDALDGDPTVDQAVSDAALIRAMLDVEAALARALVGSGLASAETAEVISRAAEKLELDPDELGRRAAESATPVIPLVNDLRDAVSADARGTVHLGATSQDIVDTALMLVAHRALEPLLGHMIAAADAAAALAEAHRGTPMMARTLGQPALPTTFGLRAAGWLAGLDAAAAGLRRIRESGLAVQLGGAAGTMAVYGDAGPQVMARLAADLGLTDPGTPWHTERSRVHGLGNALGTAAVTCGKVATDVIWLSQAEVGEVAEAYPGSSSAMPHKRNPAQSVLVVAGARRAPGVVATLLACGLHELDRAAGSWQAEWPVLREALRLAGGAAARTASVLGGLRVNTEAMRRNLTLLGATDAAERAGTAAAGVLVARVLRRNREAM